METKPRPIRTCSSCGAILQNDEDNMSMGSEVCDDCYYDADQHIPYE